MNTKDEILEEILTIAATLAGCSSLAPTPIVNTMLSRLVAIVLGTPSAMAASVMAAVPSQIITSLQKIAMTAETELENSVVQEFLSNQTVTWDDIRNFQYYRCYKELTALEMEQLGEVDAATPILFVGGGPLPLSALIMAHEYKQAVTVIDRDAAAVALASTLVERLGLSELIKIQQANIFEYVPSEDTIILAAMVGQTAAEKSRVAEYLFEKTNAHARVLARGVAGLAELLYVPQFAPTKWHEVQMITNQAIINSVHVWRKNQ